MNVEFINPFLSSMLNVMSTMAQMELTPEKPRLKKSEVAMGDVSGLIGMVSEQTKGSLSITFEGRLAIATMKKMVGEGPDVVNEEITDLVGEITNSHKADGPIVIIPLSCDLGKAYIEFSFNK